MVLMGSALFLVSDMRELYMKKALLTTVLGLFCIFQIFSLSLSDIISQDSLVALEKDGKVIRVQTGKGQAQLIPEYSPLKLSVKIIEEQLKPSIIVENLYIFRKPDAKTGKAWTEEEQLQLFNNIRAISTLTGIEYYSASRKQMRTFYEYSYVIDNPEAKRAIQDPIVRVLPMETTLFARQKDLTFGDNVYRYDYKTTNNSLLFIQTNMTTLSYGIIPLVQKENLKSLIAIIDVDEGLLLYAGTFAKASTIPGVEGKIKDSFSNRTEAIYKWFVSKAETVFK
jgi:hypothetical protein